MPDKCFFQHQPGIIPHCVCMLTMCTSGKCRVAYGTMAFTECDKCTAI